MMRVLSTRSTGWFVALFTVGCLLFAGGDTYAGDTASDVVIAQAGSNVKSFTKHKNRDGGESCSVVCKSGATASQSCSTKYPTCSCSCGNEAHCSCS
jgi:hypothetical protein